MFGGAYNINIALSDTMDASLQPFVDATLAFYDARSRALAAQKVANAAPVAATDVKKRAIVEAAYTDVTHLPPSRPVSELTVTEEDKDAMEEAIISDLENTDWQVDDETVNIPAHVHPQDTGLLPGDALVADIFPLEVVVAVCAQAPAVVPTARVWTPEPVVQPALDQRTLADLRALGEGLGLSGNNDTIDFSRLFGKAA